MAPSTRAPTLRRCTTGTSWSRRVYWLVEVMNMRTLSIVVSSIWLVGLLAMGSVAEAKGPFNAEISGGDLAAPIAIEGPLGAQVVFANDDVAVAPPETLEPAYTIKLTQAGGEAVEQPFILTMTYFPAEGDAPALLRGEWDSGDRYFRAGPEFRSLLDEAIEAATRDTGGNGVGAVWFIAPSLALGLLLAGGVVGRRLLSAAR